MVPCTVTTCTQNTQSLRSTNAEFSGVGVRRTLFVSHRWQRSFETRLATLERVDGAAERMRTKLCSAALDCVQRGLGMDAAASFLGEAAVGGHVNGAGGWAGPRIGTDQPDRASVVPDAVSALDDVRMLPASLHAMLAQPDDAYIGGAAYSIDVGAVDVGKLKASTPLRSRGLDATHVTNLVDAEWPMSPILVHLPTMQVVDGHHRVAAAVIKGVDSIGAQLFTGPLEVAYLLALRANVTHGLPLSLEDRKTAARHLLARHGSWSDRAIAAATGLSAKVIAKLRCATADGEQLDTRVGRDGRTRPLNTAAKRAWAAEILTSQRGTSLRQVALAVGLSPGTVRDVSDRLQRGLDPVPGRKGTPTMERQPADPGGDEQPQPAPGVSIRPADETHGEVAAAVLAKLTRDPALRSSDVGRDLLRRLHRHLITAEDGVSIAEVCPDRSVEQLAMFAFACSKQWAHIAEQLNARSAAESSMQQ